MTEVRSRPPGPGRGSGLAKLAFLASLLLAVPGCKESTKYPWMIVPGVRVGPIPADVSENDLRARFGDQMRPFAYSFGEGEYVSGAVVFPTDTLKRIEIAWRDTVARRELKTVRIEGYSSVWRLESRVQLGTDLFELERLNGRPFKLAGFAWDQQGVVLSWEGGSLMSGMKGVYVYLAPDPKRVGSDAWRRVLGDREYMSDDGNMRSMNPRVARIVVAFDIAAPR
ncbi:MAG TPA: hypothetical protein VFQ05_18655, partial [Candidatus Eisenbacteria bacterium]|nr:hypothetical protein [Candidatus Eisenbacteria bacterium]